VALVAATVGPLAALAPFATGSAFAASAGASASAPLSLPATGCVESFDGLSNGNGAASLPPGAEFDETGTTSVKIDGLYTADDGSSNAGDTYSLGTSASTDRAFGDLLSGTITPTLGVVVRNDTPSTITSLGVSYALEQWRLGATGRADKLTFSYSTSSTAVTGGTYTAFASLDGIAPNSTGTVGSLNGNLAANRVQVTSILTGLSIAPGASILLRWSDVNVAGADDSLGVDDLAVSPNGTSSTTPCSNPVLGGGTVTKIHDIQGNGAISPVNGQSKTVEGVVVGLDDLIGSSFGTGNAINTFPTDRGFYLEEETADQDADPATSEGIFVGLPSASTALPAIGDVVRLTGTVKDGQSAPAFGQTRIEPSSYTVVSSGNTLPPAIVLDVPTANSQSIGVETNPTRSYYETFEGMRITLPTGVAQSGGTNKFGELFLVPGTTPGVLLRTDPVQPGLVGTADDAGAGNPANPYDPAGPSSTYVAADRGDTVTGLTGPMSYSFGNYKIVPQVGALPTVVHTGVAYPYDRLPPAGPAQKRIVSFNLENFFPVGGALDGHIVTQAQYDLKLDQAADAIGRLLQEPDVVVVQEIGDNQHLGQTGSITSLGTLQALATRMAQRATHLVTYTAYSLEGNDNRGIDVGFLVKDTVTVLAGPDQRGGLTAAGTCSDVSGRLFDRPPLFLQVDLGTGIGPVWLVSNHFASKSNPDSCRDAQATWVQGQVQQLEATGNQVIVMGDLNAFETENALTILGSNVTTLTDQRSKVPHDSAYSFQFNGVLQTLDHLLITDGLETKVAAFDYAHLDNDYAQRTAQPDGHQVSDHDPAVLTLTPSAPIDVPEAPLPVMFGLIGAVGLVLGGGRLRRRALGA
jgi:predicted extracellular nuclease